jgi:hypothetical protein
MVTERELLEEAVSFEASDFDGPLSDYGHDAVTLRYWFANWRIRAKSLLAKQWKAGTGQKIDKLYAWISTDEFGEGVLEYEVPNMGWMPMVGADRKRIESYRGLVERIVVVTGRPVKLVVFSRPTVIDEIVP